MWFDFHNKVIFQHLFKTGGHSIYEAMYSLRQQDTAILNKWAQDKNHVSKGNVLGMDVGNHHNSFDQFHAVWPKINLDEYFKFCFIRNTFEVLVAGYKHQQQAASYANMPTEEDRLKAGYAYTFHHHVTKVWSYDDMQWDFMSFKGKMIMDFVGRFSHLQEDFNKVCDIIDIPRVTLNKRNSSEDRKYVIPELEAIANQHYSLWYTDELIDFVKKRAKAEIDYFGFEFEDKR